MKWLALVYMAGFAGWALMALYNHRAFWLYAFRCISPLLLSILFLYALAVWFQ